MSIQVYGIPNCGTCKKAFQWLENNQIEYEFINTKENSPSHKLIQGWIESLGSKPMRNTSGKSYRALGEEKKNWTDKEWLEAFSQDAMLLKRPLLVKDDKAVLVGFRDTDAEIRKKLGF
jgi:arsenate reductase (glutaredoxin)